LKKLFLIPARGGSKGIPGKNIKLLNGRPLIYYTLEAAVNAQEEEDVIAVSTDSTEIADVVNAFGDFIHFMRPETLATDKSSSRDVILHALDYFENIDVKFDVVVLLQPTSPLRTGKHIKEAINLYQSDLDMVVSAFETKSNPYYVLFEENSEGFLQKSKVGSFTRRQDCPKVYEFNGAIYVINVSAIRHSALSDFTKTKVFEMRQEESMDLDTSSEWDYAEYIFQKSKKG
jgi:CMP-N,N'-diacetyllegionaminic acid synthase